MTALRPRNGDVRASSARFERLPGHRTVVVEHAPAQPPVAHVLVVPAFGDEMNQTRRMVRLVAESLVERGIASTQFDLYGTGDSSADFAQASVERWLDDCAAMLESVRSASDAPVVLFGCRLGVALAVSLTRRLPDAAAALVGWAPVLQGRMQLSGLLRASKIAQARRQEAGVVDAKTAWAQGRVAFLGGYPVSPVLADGLSALDASDAPAVAAATLVDVRAPVADTAVSPSEALLNRARTWRGQGVDVEVLAVEGAPFWNVPDLVDLPGLVGVTADAIVRRTEARR